MQSSSPTISVSVKLLVLSFCFAALTMGNPLPIEERPPPMSPLMFGCTDANNASIHHFKMLLLLALRISGNSFVPLTCFIMWTNSIQLSLSSSLTLVVRKVTAVLSYRCLAWPGLAWPGLAWPGSLDGGLQSIGLSSNGTSLLALS